MKKSFGFLKTTALGGVLFLLPLIVIGALLGQVVQVVMMVAELIGEVLPVDAGGVALVILAALLVVVLLCFFAGLLARRAWGKRLAKWFEGKLVMFFPRYSILRDQMSGNLGADARMHPVLARFEGAARVGFEMERSEQGLVTVYLPGAPDPWLGSVVLLPSDRIEPLDGEFGQTVETFEKIGRGTAALIGNAGSATAP